MLRISEVIPFIIVQSDPPSQAPILFFCESSNPTVELEHIRLVKLLGKVQTFLHSILRHGLISYPIVLSLFEASCVEGGMKTFLKMGHR